MRPFTLGDKVLSVLCMFVSSSNLFGRWCFVPIGGDGQLGHGNLYNMRTPQVIEVSISAFHLLYFCS